MAKPVSIPRKKTTPRKKKQKSNSGEVSRVPVLSKPTVKKKRNHPKYGTSKLEEKFAREFLDVLGVKYIYQFEAKDIGRTYDFYLPNDNILLEVDGDFWHSNPEKYKDEDLRPHQIKARRVDEYKNKWALEHGIPLLRFWESDINNNPMFVMEKLRESVIVSKEKEIIKENQKKRHVNKLITKKPLTKGKQLLLFEK